METKELLKKLEEDLRELDRDDNEPTGNYILVVNRQKSVQIAIESDAELLEKGMCRMFEMLKQLDEEVSRNLLAMLCMQSLEENEEKKDAD